MRWILCLLALLIIPACGSVDQKKQDDLAKIAYDRAYNETFAAAVKAGVEKGLTKEDAEAAAKILAQEAANKAEMIIRKTFPVDAQNPSGTGFGKMLASILEVVVVVGLGLLKKGATT